MKRLLVARETSDKLYRQEWEFRYDERRHAIVLDGYQVGRRATRRHKFVYEREYSRLPDVPASIAIDVKLLFTDGLSVVNAHREDF